MKDDISTNTDSSLSPGSIVVLATVTFRGSDMDRCLQNPPPPASPWFLAPPTATPPGDLEGVTSW